MWTAASMGPRPSCRRRSLTRVSWASSREPLALGAKPLLEGSLGHVQTLEQRTPIQGGRLLQGGRGALAQEPLEGHDVDIDRGGIEAHRLTFDHEARTPRAPEDLAQSRHGLPETLPRLPIGDAAPQERGQRVPAPEAAGGQGQIGEQGLGLPAGHREPARVPLELEATEELETQGSHEVDHR